MKKVRVTSGPYKGRFVGPVFLGLRTNPVLYEDPEVQVDGTPYCLFAQEEAASQYFDEKAAKVQAQLKAVGLDSELV
jgi:hypothetical protein